MFSGEKQQMKVVYVLLTLLHLLVGIGATAGGLAAVTDPTSPLGMPTDMLETGPFEDYLLPGLFLMIVLGLGNLAVVVPAIKKIRFHGILSGGMGAVLVCWIVIQCYILQSIAALHVIFFLIGAVQGCLALVLLWYKDEFPMSIVKRLILRSKA